MKIAYLANFNNEGNNKHEESIAKALEDNGCEVEKFHERDYSVEEVVESDNDILLFHKGGDFEKLIELLENFDGKTICWYFDKVWKGRVRWMYSVLPHVNLAFLTDGRFVRRHNFINTYILHKGVGKEWCYEGEEKDEYKVPIAMTGNIYGERQQLYQILKRRFGDNFQVFNDVFDDNLNNLAKSAQIMIAPSFPQNDHYWSQRIYSLLGRGAFLIHPKFHDLKEDYEFGEHLLGYKTPQELIEKIEEYIDKDKEREKISKAAMEHTRENNTFHEATKEIINLVKHG